ncbi:AI-2E family transporter [Nocardioides ungokensis]|uniref:AI-2E family transporter n=1 Tax=Nocardioides ungokensis TaxID=1643322 RepID=UPI0031B62D4D
MSNEADGPDVDDAADQAGRRPDSDTQPGAPEGRRRLPIMGLRTRAEDDEGLAQRLAHQWAQLRDERRAEPVPITPGRSNFSRAQVPWGLDLAAAWGWRFLVIVAAGYVVFWAVGFFAVVVLPVVIALLITALVSPVVNGMHRMGMPRGLASILVVIAGIGFVAALLTFAGQQVANGANDLADQTVKGLDEIKHWLKTGPLHASDPDQPVHQPGPEGDHASTDGGSILGRVTEVGTASGTCWPGSSSCCSRRTSSSPTESGSGPGSCAWPRAPAGSTWTARAGSPGSR